MQRVCTAVLGSRGSSACCRCSGAATVSSPSCSHSFRCRLLRLQATGRASDWPEDKSVGQPNKKRCCSERCLRLLRKDGPVQMHYNQTAVAKLQSGMKNVARESCRVRHTGEPRAIRTRKKPRKNQFAGRNSSRLRSASVFSVVCSPEAFCHRPLTAGLLQWSCSSSASTGDFSALQGCH